jgi:hypothetical protein
LYVLHTKKYVLKYDYMRPLQKKKNT